MPEIPNTRTALTDVDFAQVDQTETADLSTGLKDAGYPDASTPANEEHNWLFFKYREIIENLQGQTPREFETLAQALDLVGATYPDESIDVGDFVRLRGMTVGATFLRRLGLNVFSTGPTGTAIEDLACDGQAIYTGQGNTVVKRAANGGAVSGWTSASLGGTVNELESDGRNVYGATAAGTVKLLDPATGSILQSITVTTPSTDLAANGQHLLVVDGNDVEIYDNLGGVPNLVATVNHGAVVNGVALDHEQGYLVGGVIGGIVIRAFDLLTGSPIWTLNNSSDILGITNVQAVEADGLQVFVLLVGQDTQQRTVLCLQRDTGEVLWGVDAGSNGAHMVVDDRWLWVADSADLCRVVDKRGGAIVAEVVDHLPMAGDSWDTYGIPTAGSQIANGVAAGDLEKLFLIPPPTEEDRRPAPRLAIPAADREARFGVKPPLFGRDFVEVNDDTTRQDTIGTFISYFGPGPGDLSVVVPEDGTYLVAWFIALNHTAAGGTIGYRIRLNAGVIHPSPEYEINGDQGGAGMNPRTRAGLWPVVLTAAGSPHTIGLDFRRVQGPGTSEIHEACILVWRIA